MNTRIAVFSVVAVALAAAGGYALYSVGMDRGMTDQVATFVAAKTVAEVTNQWCNDSFTINGQ